MRTIFLCLALLPLGCGKDKPAPAPHGSGPSTFKVADPGPALSVKQAKEKGNGEEVIVQGRVSNIVKGHATFNLIDESLDYCGQRDVEDSCPQPWDYCCIAVPDRVAATMTVDIRAADGKAASGPLGDLRLLDLVAVKGKLEKDDHGNVTVAAAGWFTRERPKLRDGLHWPD